MSQMTLFPGAQSHATAMARQPGRTVYTIGHSSYPQGRFLDMLGRWLENERRAGVEFDGAVIVDIRSRPGSRRFPQYDSERMSRWIKEKTGGRVQYKHEPRLGGLRARDGVYPLPDSHNRGLRSESFRAVADYAERNPDWAAALAAVVELAATKKLVALMCKEWAPYRLDNRYFFLCHRMVAADHLVKMWGVPVLHVNGDGGTYPHEVTYLARKSADKQHLIYPPGPKRPFV